MKFLVYSFVSVLLWAYVKSDCKYRGECYQDNSGFMKPCAVDGPAPYLIDGLNETDWASALELLDSWCPWLLLDENGDRLPDNQISTCCDYAQLKTMSNSLLIADGVLGRCPACLRNFARQICEMNCSPNQSQYVDVETEISEDIEYVVTINYRVYYKYMEDAFNACSGVIVPQTGMPAVNLMCGSAAVCNDEAWFGFTGNQTENPLAPVQVNFFKTDTEENSMNAPALGCNETFEDDLQCSCVDCTEICPYSVPYVPDICTVIGLNCISFTVGLVFLVVVLILFIGLTMLEYRKLKQSVTQKLLHKKYSVPGVTKVFQISFSKIAGFSASNPVLIFMITSWIAIAMFIGIFDLVITTKTTEIWSSPTSRSRIELEYFNSRFGPFYRTAQVFMQFKGLESFTVDNVTYGPAFRLEAVKEAISLQNKIFNMGMEDGEIPIEEVCYSPLRPRGEPPSKEKCVSMSIATWVGDDIEALDPDTYLSTMRSCINNYYGLDCLDTWGGGSEPQLALGGFENSDYFSADTLLITLPIANHILEEDLAPALQWETKFLELVANYDANERPDFVDISYSAERSIEDEIARVSVAEAVPIAISYVIMFIYVTLALGNIRHRETLFIDSKITVAIGSIIVEILAIVCAMGLMGYTGFFTTLLAINVIPFFVLSVGIDNVFLMVNTLTDVQQELKFYDDYKDDFTFEQRRRYVFEKVFEKIGPSIFLTSTTQIACFAVGTLSNFPAVETFAIFATFSMMFLFIFQITTIVALLSLDYSRSSKNRFDVLCCIKKKPLIDSDPLNADTPYEGIIRKLMEPYTNFLLNWKVKISVVIVFMVFLFFCVIYIPNIEIGLDQNMALPSSSYVYKYLDAVSLLLRQGAPVYFVLKSGLNFTNNTHQNTICGGLACNENSLVTQIFLASQYSNITFIQQSSNTWIDDFFDWTNSEGACCKYNVTNGEFCSSTSQSQDCVFCTIEKDETGIRPSKEAFEKYITFFLQDTPTETCNKAGLASYGAGVNYILDTEGKANVYETHFMAYLSPCSTSTDYITAVKYTYEVSENITAAIKQETGLDIEVFPYSIFFVYYEQYLSMWEDTLQSIGWCLLAAFVINLIVSGFNFLTTFTVIFTSFIIVVEMMGIMYFWNIPLNAVSCINLIVSLAIGVEFCSHIGYAYASSSSPSSEKVADAVQKVGATVITGITFTNIPILILLFSSTEVITVFFFRMNLMMVVLGVFHGMVFYPVLLHYLNNLFYRK